MATGAIVGGGGAGAGTGATGSTGGGVVAHATANAGVPSARSKAATTRRGCEMRAEIEPTMRAS
jgi:hypothetical protein